MPKKTRKIEPPELSEKEVEKIADQLPAILNSPLPIALSDEKPYCRLHDDHDGTFVGELSVSLSRDGDVWISTSPGHTLRFRMPMISGGMSPHTFNALRVLALAIELDNEYHPISKP